MSAPANNKTVMVVEDDPAMASMLADLLQDNGYRVVHADTGASARRLQTQERPDLVVLDLQLPDVDGLVLCSDLKATANQPIMICSGTQRKREAILGFRLGADDFVQKPFDVSEFEARVEALMRRYAPAKKH